MADAHHCSECGTRIADPGLEGCCPRCLLRVASETETSWLQEGEVVGRYRIVRFLGRGGMGEVFEALDTSLNRRVALKFLPLEDWEDERKRRRLEREARLAASLNDPGICTIFEVSASGGIPYVAMELVEGQPLSQAQFDWKSLRRVFLSILRSLHVAHQKGVVHRDLKPSNILLKAGYQPKILDFGLARSTLPPEGIQQSVVTMPHLSGTVGYMSPEQLRGEAADARSDLFSVGIILYELVAGTRPFAADSLMETVAAVLKEAPPRLETPCFPVPTGMGALFTKALAKDPGQRFQTSQDFVRAIEKLSQPVAKTKPVISRRILWLAAALVLLTLILVFPPWNRGSPTPTPRSLMLVEQARPLALGFSAANNQVSIDLLEESIRLDPEFSEAHSLLSLARLKRFWWYRTESGLLREAVESAATALALDPHSARARAVRAIAGALSSPDPGVYLELKECLRLDSRQPEAAVWLAYGFYAPAGLFQEAHQLASRLEPDGPYRQMLEAWILVLENKLAAAQPLIQQLQLSLPASDVAAHLQGRAAIQAGNLALLNSAIRMYDLLAPDKATARVYRLYLQAAVDGTVPTLAPDANAEIRLLSDLSLLMAQAHARLGRVDAAMEWLHHAIEGGSNELVTLAHRDFDALRQEPQFLRLKQGLENRIQKLAADLRLK